MPNVLVSVLERHPDTYTQADSEYEPAGRTSGHLISICILRVRLDPET